MNRNDFCGRTPDHDMHSWGADPWAANGRGVRFYCPGSLTYFYTNPEYLRVIIDRPYTIQEEP